MKHYDIAISMVNTNENEEIKQCLDSFVKNEDTEGLRVIFVFVDNNSKENLEETLKKFDIEYRIIHQEKNEGFGKSHNKALRSVDADYYFVLNPDTKFIEGQQILKKMRSFLEENEHIYMLGPKIVYPDGSLQYSCYRFPTFKQPIYSRTKLGKRGKGKLIADHFMMKDFDHDRNMPVDWIMGSAMFLKKEVLEKVGAFDDRFWMYAEDSDWCRRLWGENMAVYYFADAHIEHLHRRSSAKVPGVLKALIKNKYARQHIKSWLKYFYKWRGNHKYYNDKSYVTEK